MREFVRALSLRDVSVQLDNLVEWGPVRLPHHLREPWFETLTQKVPGEATLHFSFPTQVTPESGRVNVNFTMFEAPRIPSRWVQAHVLSDLIVLPTDHSVRAWADSGVAESKLRLCPLGVRTDLYRPGVRPLALAAIEGRAPASYSVRFLNVSELGPRKNLAGLLTAWLRATTREDDAVLIMKVGCYTPGSLGSFEAEVQVAQQRAGKSLDRAAPVHFVYELFPDADMPRLFAAATHYISLSFGEGWDLSMIEAAASDLRLIAPRHSAYLTYLDDDVATMVSSRESPALTARGSSIGELFEGANWWVPDEDEAIELIRKAIDGRDVPVASARERLVERFTWDRAAERLVEILEEAEAMSRAR